MSLKERQQKTCSGSWALQRWPQLLAGWGGWMLSEAVQMLGPCSYIIAPLGSKREQCHEGLMLVRSWSMFLKLRYAAFQDSPITPPQT